MPLPMFLLPFRSLNDLVDQQTLLSKCWMVTPCLLLSDLRFSMEEMMSIIIELNMEVMLSFKKCSKFPF